MSPLLIAALALALATTDLRAAEAASASADTTRTIEALRKKHNLPAIALVVVKDGRICDRAATGVRKYGSPARVTTNDLFHIGSCTKSMTATLAAMFIEEGKLGWTTTIAEMFPELKDSMDQRYRAVTVEQLMTHRGGVPHQPPPSAWTRAWQMQGSAREQRVEFVQAILTAAPEADPGTKYIYSNQGYSILGAMLERIANQPWEKLITERLFKPLGMTSAGFGVPGKIGAVDQPWGHVRKGGEISPMQTDNPPSIGPGGTVHCSLDDLARYTMLHLRCGGSGVRLLKPETFRKLHTPPAGADYACGWFSLPRSWANGKALTHNGSNTMWYTVMWLAPERDFSVVVATNIAGPEAEKACDEAASAMIGKWLGN
jgi:CubicO group peptidase (beta-lactamase class C family)